MSTFFIGRMAAPDSVARRTSAHSGEPGRGWSDIVERASAILAEESQAWVEEQRRKYAGADKDLRPGSAS
jgi:hypothetical protein